MSIYLLKKLKDIPIAEFKHFGIIDCWHFILKSIRSKWETMAGSNKSCKCCFAVMPWKKIDPEGSIMICKGFSQFKFLDVRMTGGKQV